MNPEWVVTGIILFGGMAAGGISLYLKRRKEPVTDSFSAIHRDLENPDKDKN